MYPLKLCKFAFALSRSNVLHAGLWHADEENIVNELLEQGCLRLNAALGTGDKYQIRLLLRFFATLSTTNVVSMQAVFGMLDSIVQGAIECIHGGELASGSSAQMETSNVPSCHSPVKIVHGTADSAKSVREHAFTDQRFQVYINADCTQFQIVQISFACVA